MSVGQKMIVEGILALIMALMLWLISRALRRGVVKFDPLFFLTDAYVFFDLTIRRAVMPFVYWPIVLLMIVFATIILVCMGFVLFV